LLIGRFSAFAKSRTSDRSQLDLSVQAVRPTERNAQRLARRQPDCGAARADAASFQCNFARVLGSGEFTNLIAAGHAGAAGRFDRLRELAIAYAFAIKVAGAAREFCTM